MNTTPSNGTSRSVASSQEPEVVKKEITYASALREEGIDEKFVARKLKDLLRAQGRRWNPKKGSWEKFEDYGTQLAALREIAKILGIYAAEEESVQVTRIHLDSLPKKYGGACTTNDERSAG